MVGTGSKGKNADAGTLKKLLTAAKLGDVIQPLHRKGLKLVFTNGCFDILHVGHVRYLESAALLGDVLVVGLNSDRSVKAIKGEKRPIVPEHQRAEVLAAVACVGYVIIFDDPDPFTLIETIRPDVLVKGADWAEDEIIGADIVKADGGRVARVPIVGGASTTGLIDRIVRLYGKRDEKGAS